MTEETAATGRERWQRGFEDGKKRDADFATLSGLDVDPVYGPPDGGEPPASIGWPGDSPPAGPPATGPP